MYNLMKKHDVYYEFQEREKKYIKIYENTRMRAKERKEERTVIMHCPLKYKSI